MTDDTELEADRDEQRAIRDAILCALQDSRRTMAPKELSNLLGYSQLAITQTAGIYTRYFVVAKRYGTAISVSLHPHLAGHHVT